MNFNKIKEDYWNISKELNIESYLNPINLSNQKDIFKEHFFNSTPYNPQFEYEEIAFNLHNAVNKLTLIKKHFSNKTISYREYYEKKIDEDIIFIKNINNRKSPDFPIWLTSLYGVPSKRIVDKANSIITKHPTSEIVIQDIRADKLSATFLNKIQEYGFSNWEIKTKEIPAKVSINPVKKIITIKKDALFSKEEVKRLIAHEIDVHVLRNENGSSQEDKLFQYGFPKYLQTEEGLAITSEYRQNLLSNEDLKKYCSRVIASHFSMSNDFYGLFKIAHENHSFDQTFSIVSRIKRGLLSTKILGGYTKDRVYLEGYLELKELKDKDLKKLLCGKIGIKEFNIFDKLQPINNNYLLPQWLNKT